LSVRRTAKNDPRNVYVEVKAVNQDGKNTKKVDVASGLISEAELQQVMANAVPTLEPVEASAPARSEAAVAFPWGEGNERDELP
jgi:hypothetical protein